MKHCHLQVHFITAAYEIPNWAKLWYHTVWNIIYTPVFFQYRYTAHPYLRITLAPFWRVSTERKQRMLFCVSCATPIHCLHCACFNLNENNVSAWRSWHRTAYAVYVQWILSKMAPGWWGGEELLNKVIIFVFFVYKKYSRSFVKLRLNPWCHKDYFNDVLTTFLDLDCVRIIAVYGRVRELLGCIKNILICVPKMNEGLTGLERHEGE